MATMKELKNAQLRERDSFEDVSVELLNVDRSYQRPCSGNAVQQIASIWNWIACGVLIIARRLDGSMWVIEGQHRLESAKYRKDIPKLPCMIWDVSSIQEEAEMFLMINLKRKTLTSLDKFRAGQAANEVSCIALAELFTKYGYDVGSSLGCKNVGCVQLLRKIMSASPEHCEKLFDLCTQIAGRGRILRSVLAGLDCLERTLVRRGDEISIYDPDKVKKLVATGMEALGADCRNAVSFLGKGGEVSYAKGILKSLNNGCKSRKINDI